MCACDAVNERQNQFVSIVPRDSLFQLEVEQIALLSQRAPTWQTVAVQAFNGLGLTRSERQCGPHAWIQPPFAGPCLNGCLPAPPNDENQDEVTISRSSLVSKD